MRPTPTSAARWCFYCDRDLLEGDFRESPVSRIAKCEGCHEQGHATERSRSERFLSEVALLQRELFN